MFDFFDFFDLFTLRFWFKLARFALFCSVAGMLTGFVTGNHRNIDSCHGELLFF